MFKEVPVAHFTDTVASGDRKASLEAIRDTIAEEIEAGVPARDLASLTRRLIAVIDALDEMGHGEKESAADEVKRKREERRKRASAS